MDALRFKLIGFRSDAQGNDGRVIVKCGMLLAWLALCKKGGIGIEVLSASLHDVNLTRRSGD